MADPRTIVILCDTAQVDGGLGKVAVTSALSLKEAGCDVIYFCPGNGTDPRLAASGVEVIELGQPFAAEDPHRLRGMRRGLWNTEAAQALRHRLAGCDPAATVLHCHGYSKLLSPAIGPVLTDGRFAAVYTMHEFFLACPNGGFFDFQRQEICTRKPLGMSCLTTHCDSRSRAIKGYRVLRQAVLHGPGKLPRHLRDVIAISDTQDRVMRPYLPKDTQVHRISNPVDWLDTDRVAVEQNSHFLFIGRLAPDKGAAELARAAKEAGVRVTFVGDGPERARIQSILPDAEVTGWLDPAGVHDWLGRARALVMPSLWYECQPLVPLEALRRGVPVITGAWNAAHEAVEHGQTGLIYDATDDLAATLSQMTPDAAGGMSRRAYAQRDSYGLSPAEHATQLLSVYSEILSR